MHLGLRRLGRGLCTSSSATLAVLRLPTTVFPLHCVSLPVVEASLHERPPDGCLTADQANEIGGKHGGKLALLAQGALTGVEVDVLAPSAGVDRERWAPGGARDEGGGWEPGMIVHAVGGRRLRLLQTGERTAAAIRLASFERVEDDELVAAGRQRALDDEVALARALLEASSERGGVFELLLCTLDEEVGMPDVHPASHPLFLRHAAQPDDPTDLAFWLSARLPLTTALRHHLLAVTCPLKRMVDVVDAMRLLLEPSKAARGSKLRIVYDTAEASGCELEPPRMIVDWSAGENEPSRY